MPGERLYKVLLINDAGEEMEVIAPENYLPNYEDIIEAEFIGILAMEFMILEIDPPGGGDKESISSLKAV